MDEAGGLATELNQTPDQLSPLARVKPSGANVALIQT